MENYIFISDLGHGSFGSVSLVRGRMNKRLFALKKMKVDESRKLRTRDSLLMEAKILANLKHPNIVAYHDSFFDTDNFYIVLDFCDGGTLEDKFIHLRRKHIVMEPAEIFKIFVQLTLAIQYIHSFRILHRDIKCQNIFLMKNGIAKIGDFGISKILGRSVDLSKTLIGTMPYFAPEMITDKPYSSKVDIWALGCVLYEMCTLHHPFEASNICALFYKIGKCQYEPLPADYCEDLQFLIKSILVRNSDERPSATALLNQPVMRRRLGQFIDQTESRRLQLRQAREAQRNSLRGGIDRGAATSPVKRINENRPSPHSTTSRPQSGHAFTPLCLDIDAALGTPPIDSLRNSPAVDPSHAHALRADNNKFLSPTTAASISLDRGGSAAGAAAAATRPSPSPSGSDSAATGGGDRTSAVSYPDDFEEPDDEESDGEVDEESRQLNLAYQTQISQTDIEEEIQEELPDGEVAANEDLDYPDDFESDDEEVLDEVVSFAREAKDLTDINQVDVEFFDSERRESNADANQLILAQVRNHCIEALGRENYEELRNNIKFNQGGDVNLAFQIDRMVGEDRAETCYLLAEFLLEHDPP